MDQFNKSILQLLSISNQKQNTVITRLDKIVMEYGTKTLQKWRNLSNNNKNAFLHELVELKMDEVIHHVLEKYALDVNVSRNSDGLTPFQLALQLKDKRICDLLKQYGGCDIPSKNDSRWLSDEDKEKSMNIVWMDLEMTSIEEPEILECAVIITDKDLNELDRNKWVIHFDKSVLKKLGNWQQETFADHSEGGNGLFADVLRSNFTKKQVEEELLAMIKVHCPPKMCPLAGSSIHVDKQVLKLEMPKVHDYLHYRIIDVTSCQSVIRRWAPSMETNIKRRLNHARSEVVNHRAMDDIEWSLAFMREFRLFFTTESDVNNQNKNSCKHHRRKRSASPSSTVERRMPVKNNPSNTGQQQLYGDEKRLLERITNEMQFDVKNLNLNQSEQKIYQMNPHLREVFVNRETCQTFTKTFTAEQRVLSLITNRFLDNLNTNLDKISTTEYWGQRKLLLTEIEFLTNHDFGGNCAVVYVGVAPGTHLNFLSTLFPKLHFILYDMNELDIKPGRNIEIRMEQFDEKCAKHCQSSIKNILFICNVHTFHAREQLEADILFDMKNQIKWHKSMKPHASLLNFRFTRKIDKLQHLKGDLIIEPWASKRACECRLVAARDAPSMEYDIPTIESQMNYFHNVMRVMNYGHDIDYNESEGLDHCYDCRTEIFILEKYLIKYGNSASDHDSRKTIAALSKSISEKIQNPNRFALLGIRRTLDVVQKPTENLVNLEPFNAQNITKTSC